jgi:hypothetical protein
MWRLFDRIYPRFKMRARLKLFADDHIWLVKSAREMEEMDSLVPEFLGWFGLALGKKKTRKMALKVNPFQDKYLFNNQSEFARFY